MDLELSPAATRNLTYDSDAVTGGEAGQGSSGGGGGTPGTYYVYSPPDPVNDGQPGTSGGAGQSGQAGTTGQSSAPDVCGTTAPVSYVGIGDSVASGEGLNYGFNWAGAFWTTGHPATTWADPRRRTATDHSEHVIPTTS